MGMPTDMPPHAGDDISSRMTHSTGPAEEDNDEDEPFLSTPLGTCVRINLARALRLSQQHAAAVDVYRALAQEWQLAGYPEEACGYAAALAGDGEWKQAQEILLGVIDDQCTPPKVRHDPLDASSCTKQLCAGSLTAGMLLKEMSVHRQYRN